jgi:hypothetical protein
MYTRPVVTALIDGFEDKGNIFFIENMLID